MSGIAGPNPPSENSSSNTLPSTENPFDDRYNFPDFEEAIQIEDSGEESTIVEQSADAIDPSTCSGASTNMLNLSIGARAALEEHRRHVARFGIDDSFEVEKPRERDASVQSWNRDPRDLLWDKLVDTTNSGGHVSRNTSLHSLCPETLNLYDRVLEIQSRKSVEGAEKTPSEQSSDYFNSSRVEQLRTPDRNFVAKVNAVTSRSDGTTHSPNESFVCSEGNPLPSQSAVLNMFPSMTNTQPFSSTDVSKTQTFPSMTVLGTENSFSLSAVDLSRISAEGSEDVNLRRSPTSSFVSNEQRSTTDELHLRRSPSSSFATQDLRPILQELRRSPSSSFAAQDLRSAIGDTGLRRSPNSSFGTNARRATLHDGNLRRSPTSSFTSSDHRTTIDDVLPRRSPTGSFTSQDHRTTIDDGLLRRSPSGSFSSHNHQTAIDELRNIFPLAEESTIVKNAQDSTFGPPPPHLRRLHRSSVQSSSSSSHRRKSPPTTSRNNENIPNFAEKLALSPIGSQSSIPKEKKRVSSSSQFNLSQRPQPWPSELGLPPRSDQMMNSIIVDPLGAAENDISTLRDSSSDSQFNHKSKESLHCDKQSPTETSSSFLLEGRRRYRTVVPTRVFLSDSDDFPEQHDSFSAPSPSMSKRAIDPRLAKTALW